MDFNLVETRDENEWNTLVASSPQGNIFSDTRYLNALNNKYTCYLLKAKHGETLAGVVIIENGSSMHEAPFPYTPYNGILFSKLVSSLQNHKRVTTEFRITEFLINILHKRYGNFSMALHLDFDDIRPFLWYNYNESNGQKFIIKTRYTAVINLENFNLEEYLKNIRAVRRQEYRKTAAEISQTKNTTLFLEIYAKTFARQGIIISSERLELVNRIVTTVLENNIGILSMASTKHGIASMALFIYDSHNAYYLFGANNPELRNTGASTALMINNICAIADMGISNLDLVGVNSPNRGDYKMSFNSVLKPYYEVKLGCL